MKKLALTLSLAFLMAGATAHKFNPAQLESGNLDHIEQDINIYADEVPGFLESVIGNQTINVRIENKNAHAKEVGLKMEGTTVQEMQMGGYPNATVSVETSVSQINEITTSKRPLEELNSALQNGGIEYETSGAFTSMRAFLATQLLSIASSW